MPVCTEFTCITTIKFILFYSINAVKYLPVHLYCSIFLKISLKRSFSWLLFCCYDSIQLSLMSVVFSLWVIHCTAGTASTVTDKPKYLETHTVKSSSSRDDNLPKGSYLHYLLFQFKYDVVRHAAVRWKTVKGAVSRASSRSFQLTDKFMEQGKTANSPCIILCKDFEKWSTLC